VPPPRTIRVKVEKQSDKLLNGFEVNGIGEVIKKRA